MNNFWKVSGGNNTNGGDQTTDTSNDERIAWALAEADQQAADAEFARRLSSNSNNGSNNGGAGIFTYPGSRRSMNNHVPRGRVVSHSPPSSATPATPNGNFYPQPQQNIPDATLPPNAFAGPRPRIRSHMCHVPCVIGERNNHIQNNVCVEMMVDTGAESSVISSELAKTLGLDKNIDRSHWGVAAGVGRARIIGKIRNVIATFGHVEFDMEFIVLDVPEKMLILGMDQLRKYNVIIDLQRDVLIFGGVGGVEVPMLPPDQQPAYDARIGDACTIS